MKTRRSFLFFLLAVLSVSLSPIPAAAGGQWYKGDLHSHSLYSDGDSTVAAVMASVESKNLDFFSLTDHDAHMLGDPEHWDDPAYSSEKAVLLYGIEWTTDKGHANLWASRPFNYTKIWEANQANDAAAAVLEAHEVSALFSINHPIRNPWKHPVVEDIDCVEIWNGPMLVNQNYRATHQFWDELLLARKRVTGVGGSDTHELDGIISKFTGHGNPTTWVYAESKDADAILAAIAAGRVSISYTFDAPRLEFTADQDVDGRFETLMGDDIEPERETPTVFKIALRGDLSKEKARRVSVPDSVVQHLNQKRLTVLDLLWFALKLRKMDAESLKFVTVIKDARIFKAWLISGGTDEIEFSDTVSPDRPAFYRAEVFGKPDMKGLRQLLYGFRIAVSNPIYANYGID
jgi:hypothetical protein